MKMTLVEKAARALYDATDSQSGDTIGTVIWNSEHLFYDTVEGEAIVDKARRACMPVCRDAVRAVLQAIREPSPEMLRAGNITVPAQDESTPCYEYDLGEDDANRVWQAMIDAALTDG
jgi:hypothetical protein